MGNIYGIRFDNRKFEIGEEISNSHSYDNQGQRGEELSGTCALFVSSENDFIDYLDGILEAESGELENYNKALNANYPYPYIYLVAIESEWGWEWGEDENEIIMNGAEVVRKIR